MFAFDAVKPADAADLVAFFERAGSACFCRYWHFTGDKNGWLERLAHAPAENARELSESLEDAATELLGVVARSAPDGHIVGWMKLTSAGRVPKLYEQRLYKNLPVFQGDRTRVLAVGCFLVDPEQRRKGVAAGLLETGIRLAQASGARTIEAFPRRGELLGDPELWMGAYPLFARLGFQIVHDFAPYPVLRREL